MKRVLVTGAKGFIASHLVPQLVAHDFSVTQSSFDICNRKQIASDLMIHKSFDVVLHLAGISHVTECEKNPDLARAVNVEGTKNIVSEIAKHSPNAHFIFFSTSHIYQVPKDREVLLKEDSQIQPQNLYAQTKWEAESFLRTQTSSLKVSILRLFNHVHKTQPPTTFLAHLYYQLLKGETKIPVGDLNLVRDMGAVSDLIQGLLKLVDLNPKHQLETFNVCSGVGKNLRSLAESLSQSMGVKAEFIPNESRFRPGEPKVIVGSNKKLSKALNWEPKVKTEQQLIQSFLAEPGVDS